MTTLERTDEKPTEANAFFTPYGRFVDFMRDRSPLIVLEGPAGTGKSRAALEKVHRILEKYPRARGLYLRNTRKSCTDSGLVTFEEDVLPSGHYLRQGAKRAQRHSYIYENGSELVVGGLDEPTKLYSTQYDVIFVQEVNECTEDQVAPLMRCMRNNRVPYQQIICDLNPTTTLFWLYEWEADGRAVFYQSRHEDNPTITEAYLAVLSNLKGALRDSLYLGKRVAAVDGSYFGEEMWRAEQDGRVQDVVPFDRTLPVHTCWDLGLAGGSGTSSGFMAIWLFQWAPFGTVGQWRWIRYIEDAGKGIEWYCGELSKWRDENGATWGVHHLPHDGETKDMFTGKSRKDAMAAIGFPAKIVPRYPLDDAEQQTNNVIGHSWFCKKNAGRGIQRLTFFRREKDQKTGLFTGRYVHDESSHGASAAMTGVMGFVPPVENKRKKRDDASWKDAAR